MNNRPIVLLAGLAASVLAFSTAGADAGLKTQAAGRSAPAAAVQPSPAFLERADQILAVYNGQGRMRPLISEKAAMEAKVSPDDVSALMERTFKRMRKRIGPALGVSHVVARTPYKGDVFVNFEKTQASMFLSIEPEAPHKMRSFSIGRAMSNPTARAH